MSRTGTVARLYSHAEEPLLAMNAADMKVRGLKSGDLVRVRSRRGEVCLRAQQAEEMRSGQVSVPMHWGARFLRGGVNLLTLPAFDPVSRQPELKHAAVQVEKLDCAWQVVAMRSGDALRHLDAVQPLLDGFDYASCGLHGRDTPVAVFRASSQLPPAAELLARLDAALELDGEDALEYRDSRRSISKRVLIRDDRLVGARLTGETSARDWLRTLMAEAGSAAAARRWVLAPVTAAPAVRATRGRIVCNCLDVSESEIQERLAAGLALGEIQATLKCGSQCGSCVPELKRMARPIASAA